VAQLAARVGTITCGINRETKVRFAGWNVSGIWYWHTAVQTNHALLGTPGTAVIARIKKPLRFASGYSV
jgi:hypothetical protein